MRRRLARLNGGSRLFQWATFDGPNGVEVTDQPAEGGHAWIPETLHGSIPGSRATFVSGVIQARAITATTLLMGGRHNLRRNSQASCDIVRTAAAVSSSQGPSVRASFLASYTVFYNPGASPSAAWQIQRRHPVSGGQVGANVLQVLTLNQVYRAKLQALGPVLLMWIDGVLVLRVEDSYVPRGLEGFRLSNTNPVAASFTLDNWRSER